MRSVVPMKLAKTGYIVLSALFCALGAVLFFLPGSFVPWIGRAMGVGMTLFGAVKLVAIFPGICTGWPFSMTWPSASCSLRWAPSVWPGRRGP